MDKYTLQNGDTKFFIERWGQVLLSDRFINTDGTH